MADEDDEDLKLAIALSLQDASGHSTTPLDQDATKHGGGNGSTAAVKGNTGPGFLGLDRASMERERLERKRKAGSPPLASKVASKPLRRCVDNESPEIRTRGVCFPKGAVKKTWAFGFPRDGSDIKIEELIQRSDLQVAVLSSFQWDMDWLFSKIDMSMSKVILVMQAKDEATKRQYREETLSMKNLRLCFPPMPPIANNMHSKLMLLSFTTHLRIVVPSANLVSYDWGESGHMENSMFIIDLHRIAKDGQAVTETSLPGFGKDLLCFCKAMGLPEDIVKSLLKFDFTASEPYAFVHSIGGMHSGEDNPWQRTGYPGLGRAVKQLGLAQLGEPLHIDFVASSIGSLNKDFLEALYLAAQGDNGTSELSWRTPTAAKSLPVPQKRSESFMDRFNIYFPSHATVASSRGGPRGAGTVCLQQQWFEGPKFPRESFRDCKSTRAGLLMHNKVCMLLYRCSWLVDRTLC